MIINSYQTAKEKRNKQILFKQRLYEIQNNDSYNCNEFEITKQNKLLEFRRLANIATQIAQLNKSKTQTDKVKSLSSKVDAALRSVSPDDDTSTTFKKMSNAIVLLSQMISATADVSRSSTLSSVANSILTKDITSKLDSIIKRKRR
jgi:hypothetical protein